MGFPKKLPALPWYQPSAIRSSWSLSSGKVLSSSWHAPPSTPPSGLSSALSAPYDPQRKCAAFRESSARERGGEFSWDAVPYEAEQSPHLWLPSSIRGLRWQVRSGGRASVRSLLIRVVENVPGKPRAKDARTRERSVRALPSLVSKDRPEYSPSSGKRQERSLIGVRQRRFTFGPIAASSSNTS